MEIILETARLIIRKTELSDSSNMMALNADPLVVRYTGDGPLESIEKAEAVAKFVIDQYTTNGYGRWMLELKDTHEFIGWCGLKFHPDTNETDLGYRLMRNHWNNGFATEAAKACIDYGFERLGLQRIIGNAMKENSASIKVFEKIGMRFFEERSLHDEEAVVYEILKP